MILRPQPGPQEQFAYTPADIAVIGGAAGVGKSFGLVLEPLRHYQVPGFDAAIFRRTSTMLTTGGGLWDTSGKIYPAFGARGKQSPMHQWTFPSTAKVMLSHLHLEKHLKSWDGSELALIGFDELQHFPEVMFWYMLSRNRTMCGVKPYLRASCNPDPDSFLLEFLSWWIDQETGFPILERSGKIRWFVRISGKLYWADTPEELHKQFAGEGVPIYPKSVTFIPGNVDDNQILMERNPEYKANLHALLDYEKMRLLYGNWFARPTAGELMKAEYFTIQETAPEMKFMIRYWDRAATEPNETNRDPDWTAGVKLGVDYHDRVWILDSERDRLEPGAVEMLIRSVAIEDTRGCVVGLEQDPGAAGKAEIVSYESWLDDNLFETHIPLKTKSKLATWKPAARYGKQKGFMMLKGKWNKPFIREVEGVTDGSQPGHDDQMDGFSGAFNRCQEEILNSGGSHHLPNIG